MKVKWAHNADPTASSTSAAAAAVATTHGDTHSLADQPYALSSSKPVAKKNVGKRSLPMWTKTVNSGILLYNGT